MAKLTLDYLEYLLKDELKASKEYKNLSKKAMTKGEKEELLIMSRQEANHADKIRRMIRRRK